MGPCAGIVDKVSATKCVECLDPMIALVSKWMVDKGEEILREDKGTGILEFVESDLFEFDQDSWSGGEIWGEDEERFKETRMLFVESNLFELDLDSWSRR